MNHADPSDIARMARIRAGNSKGGRSRSPAKLAAVRANGRKGGRPRKVVLSTAYGEMKGGAL